MSNCLKCTHDETEHRKDILLINEKKYNRMCEHPNCRCRGLLLNEVVE